MMLMSNGKKISLYVSDNNRNAYDCLQQIAEHENVSVSKLLNDGIVDICSQKFANVKLSVGAYLALADGRFDLLNRTRFDNGLVMITLAEDGYKLKDGSKGEYADKMNEWNNKF